jgi:hypothetical protein
MTIVSSHGYPYYRLLQLPIDKIVGGHGMKIQGEIDELVFYFYE